MKIAYVTTFDLDNPASWPERHLGLYGASAQIAQHLKNAQTSVEYLGALERKRRPINRIRWQFYHSFCHKDFYSWADPLVSEHYARQIEQRLSCSNADILLCPENAIPLARVEPDRPMVLWTDATLGSLINFYPYLSNLCAETRHNLLMMEKRVLERCSLIILTSQWAAQQAHNLYDIPLSKIKVIPRGSNQCHDLSPEAIESIIEQREQQPCKLLFVGVEWHRKGGDTALKVAQSLNSKGLKTELHIVGCKPPIDLPDFVKVHGFLDRLTAAGKVKMEQLFQSAHFLILPSRADTFGIVLSEAASFALPALANEVGGIASIVQTNVTGKSFPAGSDPEAYCQFVTAYMTDYKRYKSLARSTFEYYQSHISWSAISVQARTALEALLTI